MGKEALLEDVHDGQEIIIRNFRDEYLDMSIGTHLSLKKTEADAHKFKIVKKGKNKCAFINKDGKYLTAYKDQLRADSTEPLRQQTFKLIGKSLRDVRLFNQFLGYYVSGEPTDTINCSKDFPTRTEVFMIVTV